MGAVVRHWIGIVAMVAVGCAASDAPVDATATADGTATDLGNEEESATPDVDASPDAPVEASHAPRTLQFVELVDDLNSPTPGASSATFTLHWDSSRDLKVRLVEGASPVAGVPVRFERLDDTLSATQLASPTIATDDAGVATDAITALRACDLIAKPV